MLAAVARVVFPRPPRRAGSDERFDFLVDGIRIEVVANGPRGVRLLCMLPLPPKEADLRALMAQYFRYCDVGADILCADPDGQLMLIAEIGAGDDPARAVAAFCDAAVHWGKMAARSIMSVRPAIVPTMIFP